MTTTIVFRNIVNQIKTKAITNLTLVPNQIISGKVSTDDKFLKILKHVSVRSMSSMSKIISENETICTSKRPYTVVVEGNIGSGKVIN